MRVLCRLLALISIFALPLAVGADCMGPYPPSMVRAFNQNCAKEATMLPFCTCIMDEVQKSIPLADFIEIGNTAGGINGDPRFIKASTKCSSLLSGGGAQTPAAAPAAKTPPAQSTPQSTPQSNTFKAGTSWGPGR